MTLLDVISTSDSSVRLSNCIKVAMDDDSFPIRTIGDYLHAGDKAEGLLLRIQNMGKKTVVELDKTIKELIEVGAPGKIHSEIQNKPYDIPPDVACLSISEIVESNLTSERLRNSVRMAEINGGLPFETIGDYIKKGSKALGIILKLPNLGRKTAKELDNLIKEIVSSSNLNISQEANNLSMQSVEANEQEIDIPDMVEMLLDKFRISLTEREYSVLKYRAVDNKTLEEIGQIHNVTRERIRQIEGKAISKLLKIYKEVFNIISKKIDDILDESYGEVGLLDASSILDLTPDILKLLTYICADQCIKPVRIRHGYLLRSSTESNYSEWNEGIDEVLFSLKWPISISEVYNNIMDIPISYVERYMVKKRGAIIQGDTIVELRKIPQTVRMVYVLRDAGHPLHSSEIARKYNSIFGLKIKEHAAQATVNRMEEALIVARGVYSLYESLNITEKTIEEIRRYSYNYIRNEEEYVSSKVLYRELFKIKAEYQEIDNAYIIHGILQDDARFIFRRGLMVGIREHEGFVEFKPLTDEVHELLGAKGPLSVSQIKTVLSERRNVLSVSISKIAEDSDEIIKITPGMYDTIINVFDENNLYQHFKLAISIALSDHEHGLFELTSNLRLLKIFNAIDITKSMVASILDMMDDVTRKKQNYSFYSQNKEIEKYNRIINSVDQGESIIDAKKEVEKIFGVELAHKYISADYRMLSHPHDISSSNNRPADSGGEISSILSAFGI